MSLIATLQQIQAGDTDDPTRDMSNWNAIRNVVNGSLDTTNLSSSAGIVLTQLANSSAWATYTITFGGFSANPTYTSRYIEIGKLVVFEYYQTANGTSNGTSFTISLPLAAANTFNMGPITTVNNGASGLGHMQGGGATLTLYLITGTNFQSLTTFSSWTNSGSKGADGFIICYEAA